MKNDMLENLKRYGQEHLLTFWELLSDLERCKLKDQIESIDFSLVNYLYANRNVPVESLTLADLASDPPAYKFSTVTDSVSCKQRKPISSKEAAAAGENMLRCGKVGAILVAGGQGTRLGFNHPKGMYPIGPVSGASLFQIHFEKMLAVSKRYGYQIPYGIMTSPATHNETVEFLKQNNYFNLREDDIFIFCQGTMPAVAIDSGKVLLESKGGIALSPDGHGGMLKAVTRKNDKGISILDNFKQRGIEYLFYNQIDNPLVQICSPEFLGYHFLSDSEFTCQVIRKRFPTDRVGNIVEVNDRLYVIEYIDLPEAVACQTNSDGSLKIWAGSIAVHIFNVEFLERMSKIVNSLSFHIARKRVSFIDISTGKQIKSDKENAIKFERFIFDLLPFAENAVVVEVDPFNHYSPLKNVSGSLSDSPETVKNNITALHTDWLRKAGAIVEPKIPIEISPLFADSIESVKQKIKAGTVFNKAAYLSTPSRN
ncbi:MAG: UTP--glucose-1-phosphate uridylyltransferase [Planctomycetaceae bacterium]|jgi:UDP-N-acetylglucosamine/UDP-N-acetylgalactosamine diphosphorylase|nr:UTP--glucose-1-phosphate uridylyltransferase [Planctomycetaceae bacterium]